MMIPTINPGKGMSSAEIFIPGRLVNPLNQRWHWSERHRWAKSWRQKTQLMLLRELGPSGLKLLGSPETPKHVRLIAHVRRRFDHDGLVASLKGVVDGLQDAGIIHNDGPKGQHRFEYDQVIDHAQCGVEVFVDQRNHHKEARHE